MFQVKINFMRSTLMQPFKSRPMVLRVLQLDKSNSQQQWHVN